jgi:hypothetical protein
MAHSATGRKCFIETMKTQPNRGHAKTYYGEDIAQPLLEWLNTPRRKSQRVDEMLLAFADIRAKRNEYVAVRTIRAILKDCSLRLVPWWSQPMVQSQSESPFRPGVYRYKLDRSRSVVEWDPVSPRMSRAEALAMRSLLDLSSQALLDHVRLCARQECGTWFYVHIAHQHHCSKPCQQAHVRGTQEWKERRSAYMRRRRHEEKVRMQNEIQRLKRKAGKNEDTTRHF